MRDEQEAKLVEAYPQIFRDVGKPATESCMAWGIAVGRGWFNLIDKLCSDIMALDPPPEFKAEQVKEKFGGLRFYTSGGNQEIGRLVSEAERRSYKICEDCGSEENVTCEGRPHWVTTLCNTCAEALKVEQEKKRKEREAKQKEREAQKAAEK